MSDKKTIGERVDAALDTSDKKTIGERIDSALGKSDEKTVGERVDEVKKDVSDTAHDIKASVKKAVEDTGDAVADLIHTKK
ncbi:MAG: hypothetical protein WCX65_05975 [bacterium]